MSFRCLSQISIDRDISKTSQKHLKRDVFFETSLRRLKYISKMMSFLRNLYDISNTSQKRCLCWDLFKTSQIHLKKMFFCDLFKGFQTYLKKNIYSVTFLIRLKIYLKSICDYLKTSRKNGFVLIKQMCGRWKHSKNETLFSGNNAYPIISLSWVLVGRCLHVVYLSSIAYKSFGSFAISIIVKCVLFTASSDFSEL